MNQLHQGSMVRLAAAVAGLVLAVDSHVFGVPASPRPVDIQQPDGTTIRLVLKGDEYFHWHEDTRGYAVVKSPDTGQWVYAREGRTRLLPTDRVVGRVDPVEAALAKPDMRRVFSGRLEAGLIRDRTAVADQQVASTGTMRNLVLLVNFSDVTIGPTRQQFDDLFNQANYTTDGAVGSVRDYYLEVSYNLLTVNSTVVDAVTLTNTQAHYGGNDALGDDLRPKAMVSEALAALEQRGFDFSTMDGDNDGWVDGLTVIHAGGGEEYAGNDPDYIWSHQWDLDSAVTYDGKKLQMYHTEPARRGWDGVPNTQGITRIGVICHETGHFLGLPDLYDRDYSSEGAGDFCLMAGGSWNPEGNENNLQRQPAHMSAWCKAKLSWLTPSLVANSGTYLIAQVEDHTQVHKLQSVFPSNEYFLIENRQGFGFDAGLPGTDRGLLIWHVDENQSHNDDETHYKVDLEEASGVQQLEDNTNDGDDWDYFWGGYVTLFTGSTTPDNLSYGGVALGLDISNISSTGLTMRYTVTRIDTWVDFFYSGTETGSFLQPFNTIAEGAGAVPTGGHLMIKSGSSSEGPTISKAMTLHAYRGSVVIGE